MAEFPLPLLPSHSTTTTTTTTFNKMAPRMKPPQLFVSPRKLSTADIHNLQSPTAWLHAFPSSAKESLQATSVHKEQEDNWFEDSLDSSSRLSGPSAPKTREYRRGSCYSYRIGDKQHDDIASAISSLMAMESSLSPSSAMEENSQTESEILRQPVIVTSPESPHSPTLSFGSAPRLSVSGISCHSRNDSANGIQTQGNDDDWDNRFLTPPRRHWRSESESRKNSIRGTIGSQSLPKELGGLNAGVQEARARGGDIFSDSAVTKGRFTVRTL
ncbi:hypothetical protein BDR26DRAFT_869780 [Obelidium mucronatum]|nr:hypothetical protein BDR26DRAFT_869780 [Obelidium mucronatum]